MADEIKLNLMLTVANGNFAPSAIQKNMSTDQSAIGNAGGVMPVPVMVPGTVLHGYVAKPSAKAATTTTLAANTYANASAGVGATLTANGNGALAAVDGITLKVNETILVKNEASGLKCGLYLVTTLGDGSNPYVLTRSTAMDATDDYVGGSVYVEGGTVNGGQQWTCTNPTPPTVGTTSITFAQSSTGTVIDYVSVTTPGYLYLENLDDTNFIDVGPEVAGVVMPTIRLLAGECAVLRVTPTTILRAVANTAIAKLYYQLFQN